MNLANLLTDIILLTTVKCIAGHSAPNIVLILADDLGFGDLSSYGHPIQEPGPVDKLASRGIRFTQAYAPAVFCTPSRAAMLTGRQPFRTGMVGPHVVHLPAHAMGLPHDELTIAEVLKEKGYRTGMVGKWHQGINKYSPSDGFYLPHSHGFDYVGTILPWTLSASCDTSKLHHPRPDLNKCFVYRNTTPIQQPIQLEQLTPVILHDAQAFLHNTSQPFFLYYSLPQTHTPMFNMPRFRGSSQRGVYGDQIQEMQWAVGELLSTLDQLGMRDNTLVVFTSDHGPHRERALEGGSAGPLKGGKANFYEGGLRVPLFVSWPAAITLPRTDSGIVSLMDLLPTLLDLAGGQPPADRHIDGVSFAHLLDGSSKGSDNVDNRVRGSSKGFDSVDHSASPRFLPFFCDKTLMAVRYGPYKMHLKTAPLATEKELHRSTYNGIPLYDWYKSPECASAKTLDLPGLYNVEHDPAEQFPLDTSAYAEVIEEIYQHITEFSVSMQGSRPMLLTRRFINRRVVPCCNPPFCICVESLLSKSVCPVE